LNKIYESLRTNPKAIGRGTSPTSSPNQYADGANLFPNRQIHHRRRTKRTKPSRIRQETLKILSQKLSQEFGKGFSEVNLRQMKNFYWSYQNQQTLSATSFALSWSHYLVLMRIENLQERAFYEIESASNNWSLRELKRQFDSALFERLALSTDKEGIQKLASQGQLLEKPQDALKDPYILEFLNLPEKHHYSEADFENALIDKLEHFLLELGKGYTFVARQKQISFDEKHFYIDLVFFNRLLKCFVLIDLKIGELKAQDIGQMQLYVNFFDRNLKLPEENKTVGCVFKKTCFCTQKRTRKKHYDVVGVSQPNQ